MRVSHKLVFVFVVSLSPLTGDVLFGHASTMEFGVYSETIGRCILYDAPGACCRDGIYNSSGSTISVSPDFTDPPEGSESLVFEIDVLAVGHHILGIETLQGDACYLKISTVMELLTFWTHQAL